MKSILTIIAASLLICACDTPSPTNAQRNQTRQEKIAARDLARQAARRDQLARRYHYSAFTGQQEKWPTAPGAFVRTVKGISIYTTPPSQPYIVLGTVDAGNETDLADCVQLFGAQAAVILSTSEKQTGAWAMPIGRFWIAQNTTQSKVIAYLIKFSP